MGTGGKTLSGSLRLLLVEDDAADAALVLREVRLAGFELTHRQVDTEGAYRAALTEPWDVILSDYAMPQFSGMRALEILQELDVRVPFIVVSGTIGEDSAVAAMRRGAADYLLKDRLKRLGDAIAQSIQRGRLERERRTMESALVAAEARYRALVEQSTDGIYSRTLEGRFLSANVALAQMWGYRTVEELLASATIQDLHACVAADRVAAFERLIARDGRVVGFEVEAKRRDGRLLWAAIDARVVRDARGEVRIDCTMRDITVQKVAEEARRRSEERLQLAMQAAQLGIWSWDLRQRSIYWSPETLRIVGLDQFSGQPGVFESLIHPDDRERNRALLEAALASGRPFESEYRIRRPDGAERWLVDRAKVEYGEQGEPFRVTGVVKDITEEKAAALALADSEERFRQIAENIDEVFWMLDPLRQRMLYVSPGYERVWDRPRVALYENAAEWLAAVHPEDRARVARANQFNNPRVGYDEVYRIVRPDATIRWVRARAYPIIAGDGSVGRVVGTVQDVTDYRRLEEQFRQAQKMEAIGTLAGGIAHDFNNILTAITGYSGLARASLPPGTDVADFVGEIERAATRAADLVRQILAFGRRQDQQRARVNVAATVAESFKLLRATLPSTIAIELAIADNLPPISADASQIHQVLMNLGTNAWHAMREQGGGVLRVTVREGDPAAAGAPTGLRGRFVEILIADTGHGMDEETRKRIFEPFFTTKGPGEGTGLGLAVVHGIVLAHEGVVEVTSRRSVGTTFRLCFPALEGRVASTHPFARAETRGNGERILVVDDEESIVEVCRRSLEAHGYVVEAFNSVAQALNKLEAQPEAFDLVLSDQTMPIMTGLEFAQRVRALRPGLPFVLMSGYSAAMTPQRLSEAGIEHILAKPHRLEDLTAVINRALTPGVES